MERLVEFAAQKKMLFEKFRLIFFKRSHNIV